MAFLKPQQSQTDWLKVGEQMKERGLTCSALKDRITTGVTAGKDFRAFGWQNLAQKQEDVVTTLKELDKRVCILS